METPQVSLKATVTPHRAQARQAMAKSNNSSCNHTGCRCKATKPAVKK